MQLLHCVGQTQTIAQCGPDKVEDAQAGCLATLSVACRWRTATESWWRRRPTWTRSWSSTKARTRRTRCTWPRSGGSTRRWSNSISIWKTLRKSWKLKLCRWSYCGSCLCRSQATFLFWKAPKIYSSYDSEVSFLIILRQVHWSHCKNSSLKRLLNGSLRSRRIRPTFRKFLLLFNDGFWGNCRQIFAFFPYRLVVIVVPFLKRNVCISHWDFSLISESRFSCKRHRNF